MQLTIITDLNKCVGCKSCQVSCKEHNTSGDFGAVPDHEPYREVDGMWWNRVLSVEAGEYPQASVMYLPKACMHCYDAPCVPVCPTGASYKRQDNGVVLIDYDSCIGCQLCMWACPYGVREFDEHEGVVKKCTMCIDRIEDETLPEKDRQPACVQSCPTHARTFGDLDDPESEVSKLVARRQGFTLLPELGARPSVHYLPRRPIPHDVDEDEIDEVLEANQS
ncbi:MAG: 4Fe-4S dicluster domain-containing protein [Firmicutes bacterium]|uniref:4Fe-4S ferredoxin n=1 Tax=Sulfobacillus benefaciens TaxID=453960 RepID=A0A2T2X9G2_9FIRM|nr:4Fe-4S dicluster domain-containing protein [Bacillota bacterium]MCL5013080.1 4Fe-4S dicluster domain-containing protein [Bacillota bacterium]PSR31086.1 MAG: 4Fe-4S ferredoxin [Sulfobacillus benefaciens]